MEVKERIEVFNEENRPFYICDHDDVGFSLCLPLNSLTGEYDDYCQKAFDRYTKEKGNGMHSYGTGRDWEIVFRKAFIQDADLEKLLFDCEAGGFYCYANELSVLETLGRRFRALCEDEDRFTRLVDTALTEAKIAIDFHVKNRTVMWYLQGSSEASMDITTPDMHIRIEAGQGRELASKRYLTVYDIDAETECKIPAGELLNQRVVEYTEDLDKDHLVMKTEKLKPEELPVFMQAENVGNQKKARTLNRSVKNITTDDLRQMKGKEGLILQGCGGELQEWVDGVNETLIKEGILLDGTRFENCLSFECEGRTCMLYPFEDVKMDVGKLAIWRIRTHAVYGSTWLSDFVDNRLGGFTETEEEQRQFKPDCPLIGQDGNIFNLMGIAARTLKENGMVKEAQEMTARITATAGSYHEAINIIGEYVTIVSVDEEEESEIEECEERVGMDL